MSLLEIGGVSDCANLFSGLTLSSDNYDGEIRDITILTKMSNLTGERLTPEDQFAIRSVFWN